MVLNSVGNVGIGTIAPSALLDVNGSLRAINVISTNISAGTISLSSGVTSASAQITNANITTVTAGTIVNSNASMTTATIGTILNSNAVSTNISSGTLNLSSGITAASAQITNANVTTQTIATLLSTNQNATNISAGTLNISTGVTSASAQITNANVTTATIGTLISSSANLINAISTNVSSGTLNLSTGVTSASAQITNANFTTITAGTARVTTSMIATGNSNTMGAIITTGGNVGINTTSPGYTLDVNGTIYTNTLLQSSDKRFKTNISKITGCLEKIKNTTGYIYDKKVSEGETKREIGFIAQELEIDYPELVSTDANGYKSVAYANITAVLVEGIKDLEQKVKESDNKIVEQTVIISDLQEKLRELALRILMLESKNAF
jgi:hypothetical protein